jgi:hypothetical protein
MKLHWPAPNRSLGVVDALGITGALGLLVARFIPIARLPFWGCTLRRATGWPCPGCGLTRAADRFAHGDFAGAWHANPLGTVAAALFVGAILATALHLTFRVPLPVVTVSPREAWWLRAVLVGLLVLNYAYVIVATKFPQVL